MDKIIIKGLKIFAYHGVNDEEKHDGQFFVIDITAGCELRRACRNDSLAHTVSYASIIKCVRKIMTEQSYDLLECAAQSVCDGLFENFDKISELTVMLKKPDAPIKAEFEYAAVEIKRQRE